MVLSARVVSLRTHAVRQLLNSSHPMLVGCSLGWSCVRYGPSICLLGHSAAFLPSSYCAILFVLVFCSLERYPSLFLVHPDESSYASEILPALCYVIFLCNKTLIQPSLLTSSAELRYSDTVIFVVTFSLLP